MNTETNNPKGRTIYDAGSLEIFWKNFLAGMGKTLGSIFLYLIFLVIVYYLFMQYVFPKFAPMLEKFSNMMDTVEKLQNIQTPQINIPNLPGNFPSLLPGNN